jgi:hypothetical protein
VRVWLRYAGVGLLVTLAGVALASLLGGGESLRAVQFAAALAYGVQLCAFAALVAVRGRSDLFLLGWVGGLILRFATVGLVAVWLSRDPVFPPRPALLSLVAFVFVLLLLEPLFLRRDLQTR